MIIKEHYIPEEDIKDITITNLACLITTTDRFYNIRYRDKTEIKEAIDYKEFMESTTKDLYKSISLIAKACHFFLDRKEQCLHCPLNKEGCILKQIPYEWEDNT